MRVATVISLERTWGLRETSGASLRICAIAERPHHPSAAEMRMPLPSANITPLPISKKMADTCLKCGKTDETRQVTAEKNTMLAETERADKVDEERAAVKDIFLTSPPPVLFFDLKHKTPKYAQKSINKNLMTPSPIPSDATRITKAGLGREESAKAFFASSPFIRPSFSKEAISLDEDGIPEIRPPSTTGNSSSDKLSRFQMRLFESNLDKKSALFE
ncbi:MAG: hypothetical protein E7613_07900 [Ruminococcaceae bacterium]|nr:hypothetical protein [Oscillospiraceae bacterium]